MGADLLLDQAVVGKAAATEGKKQGPRHTLLPHFTAEQRPYHRGRAESPWHAGQVDVLASWAQKAPFSTRAKTGSRSLRPGGWRVAENAPNQPRRVSLT